MVFKIADGSSVDIVPGSLIKVKPGYVPAYFDDKQLQVTKIAEGYPFALFYKEEVYYDVEGQEQVKVTMDEESAVAPEIILEVV